MSNLIMFYDTETTDRTDFQAAYDAPHQPNLIQLGYRVVDPKTRAVIFEVGHLVDSTGLKEWKGISEGAASVHKITEEDIRTYGVHIDKSIQGFEKWASRCSLFVAHNEKFDNGVMQCAAKRAGFSPDLFSTGSKFCTMQSGTGICKVPNRNGRAGFKWPTLQEAYTIIVDPVGFKGAHNALADVNACHDIFWGYIDGGHIPKQFTGIEL